MDVKNTLSELINFENKPNQSFREIREIEKLILVMLKDYITTARSVLSALTSNK